MGATGPDGPPPLPLPGIIVIPTVVNIASVSVGDSASLMMTIASVGETDLVISEITSPQDFRTDFTPPQTLAPGESLTVNVTFAPTEAREYADTLWVVSNDPHGNVAVRVTGEGIANAAGDVPLAPREFVLRPVYPNPFNAVATIGFDLPRTSDVKVRVFDVTGREVAVVADANYPAGNHKIMWRCEGCASGVYLVKMEAAGFQQLRKVVLMK